MNSLLWPRLWSVYIELVIRILLDIQFCMENKTSCMAIRRYAMYPRVYIMLYLQLAQFVQSCRVKIGTFALLDTKLYELVMRLFIKWKFMKVSRLLCFLSVAILNCFWSAYLLLVVETTKHQLLPPSTSLYLIHLADCFHWWKAMFWANSRYCKGKLSKERLLSRKVVAWKEIFV